MEDQQHELMNLTNEIDRLDNARRSGVIDNKTIQESITKICSQLDGIETNGIDEVRNERKVAITKAEEVARLSQEEEEERREKSAQAKKSMLCKRSSCSSRTSFTALLCCCSIFILIPGITCLTLGLLGYFTIDEPSMDLTSVTIIDIEMGYEGNVTGFIIGPMLNFLDMLTNDAASDIVPTQAIVTMEMVLLFNNTNTYNVRIEQGDMEGQIIIPACAIDNVDEEDCGNVNEMIIPNNTIDDIVIGTWNIPKIVLGSESSTEIPISIKLTIDLLHGNTKDLASLFIFGGRLVLIIEGDINVKSWIPGMHGQVYLQCLAELEEIQNFLDEKPNVNCRHSTNVADWITVEGVIDPMFRRVLTTEEGDDDWTTTKRSVLEMTQSTNNTRHLNVSTTQQYEITYEYCDDNALPAESTSVSDLTRNKFYKICPGTHGNNPVSGMPQPLGQPRCGDGSNYSFLFSRPLMETNNATMKRTGEKILIELAGGGACWDNATCQIQSFALKIPGFIVDPLVGTACSDANDAFGSLLCDRSIGSVNFSTYNFVFVPYCTQDVFMGDNLTSAYNVRHVGAHNLYRTLRWIFDNFHEPSEFVITGCSAGATPLMVVYDLINSHYNNGTTDDEDAHQVRLVVIEDSPVYLTPPYYLSNYLPHWNVGTIFDLVDFDFELYKLDETFPDAVREHVMRRGKLSDEFALVTHNADEVSLFYYGMMSGSFNMSNPSIPDANSTAEWWSKMNGSINLAKQSHGNFDAFVVEGSDHCTFSLVRYYSLSCPLLLNTRL